MKDPNDPSATDAAPPALQVLPGGKRDAPEPEPDTPPPFDPQHPYWMQHIASFVQQLTAIVRPFAPNVALDQYPAIAAYELGVQTELINPKILPSMISPGLMPCLHIRITDQATGHRAVFPAYKRLEDLRDPQLAITQAMALAFLLAPAARALLRMHLYSYDFFEADDPRSPRRPTIVKP